MAYLKRFARRARRTFGRQESSDEGGGAPTLPTFPADGLIGTYAIVRAYLREDLAGRAALEESQGVQWAQMPKIADRMDSFFTESHAALANGRGPYQLAVVGKADGRYAGEVYVETSGEASATYAAAFLPEFRHTRVSMESLMLIPNWLMTTSLHRLEASHSIENIPAHRALLRMSFPVEGVKRLAYPLRTADGIEWYDECCHAMVNENA